jgi:UDP-glucose 4-epimerase
MRVAVTGATGNVGTSVMRALAADPAIASLVGVARRRPRLELAKTEWVEADVERDDLARLFRGTDTVVHLAWRIQPSRDLDALWRTNVHGSSRTFRAALEAGVKTLVYASSVGVYSPGQ